MYVCMYVYVSHIFQHSQLQVKDFFVILQAKVSVWGSSFITFCHACSCGGYEETTCSYTSYSLVRCMHAWVLDYRVIPTVTAALFVW